jgi:hypothetical protein
MVDEGDGEGVASSDRWALPFIGVNYVRNILEAFDDDASGFVTVKEATILPAPDHSTGGWFPETLSSSTCSHSTTVFRTG